MTVTVRKLGGSVAVLIPRSVARELELSEGTSLELTTTDKSLIMRKGPRRRRDRTPLAQIVAKIKSTSYRRRNREMSERGPVGREVW